MTSQAEIRDTRAEWYGDLLRAVVRDAKAEAERTADPGGDDDGAWKGRYYKAIHDHAEHTINSCGVSLLQTIVTQSPRAWIAAPKEDHLHDPTQFGEIDWRGWACECILEDAWVIDDVD